MLKQIKSFTEIEKILHNSFSQKDIEFIRKAYLFAKNVHHHQKRKSGDPYLYHLLQVSYYLAIWGQDVNTITSGLLHDCIEDQNVTPEEINEKFNKDVAELVEHVTKVTSYSKKQRHIPNFDQFTNSNMRKIILAMSSDIRVILIKLADRYHNIQTLEYLNKDKATLIAKQTDAVYLPIAMRLGLEDVVDEMNTKIFFYTKPKEYKWLSEIITQKAPQSQKSLELLIKDLTNYLTPKVKSIKISGRVKNIRSIYNKLDLKNKNIEEIYDSNGVRIIVDSIEECYLALGYIQSKFQTLQSKFKDYIANPKSNLYQSLHLPIIFQKKIFEVQIRTFKMDACARNGIASHVSYKNELSPTKTKEFAIEKNLNWFQGNMNFSVNNSDVNKKLIKTIMGDKVYAITPNDLPIELPLNATVLDFAYKIHTKLAEKASGAYVNGEYKKIDYKLQSGDVVEIKTNSNQKPNKSWLDKVVTSTAKHSIKKYLKNQEILIEKEILKKGKEKFTKFLIQDERNKVYLNKHDFIKITGFNSWDDLYINIGLNKQKPSSIIKKYQESTDNSYNENEFKFKQTNATPSTNSSIFIIDGIKNIEIKIAKCCLPIYGDKIVGQLSKTAGIKAHRHDCLNLKNISDENKIFNYIVWNKDICDKLLFTTKLVISFEHLSNDNDNLKSLLNFFNKEDVKLIEFFSKKHSYSFDKIETKLKIKSKEHLEQTIKKLKLIKNIISVERVF